MTRLLYILGGLTLCVTCFHPHSLPAQPWMSPGQIAMAGVGIGVPDAIDGPNPASRGTSMVMTGVIREFGLPELTSSTLLLGFPRAAVGVRHLAFSGYGETALVLSGSFPISGWRFGGRLRETWIRPAGFRTRLETEFTLGALLALDGNSIGLAVTRDRLRVGWSAVKDSWTLAVDVQTSPSGLAPGVGWRFDGSQALSLLGGVATNPARLGMGASVRIDRWSLLLGFQRHLVLGWTSALAIAWG
ncbi:MAG: hypothetical protein ACI9W4_002920 [Rhodothermales bacterium]|jgi:hypothetical protein